MTYDTKKIMYKNNSKITELESIRGLAAIIVVLFHIPKWNKVLEFEFINNGYLMVDLFFVLSGFVIFSAYSNNINSNRDLIKFQMLRFGRLYPVHITFLIIFILFETLKYAAKFRFNIEFNSDPFSKFNIYSIIENALLIHAIGPTGNELSFNYPSWSISVEFYTYFLFGLIILYLKNYRILIFTAIASISVILLNTGYTFGSLYLLKCLSGFFIGCLTSECAKKINFSFPSYLSFIIFITIIFFLQNKPKYQFDVSIYFLTSMLILSLINSKNGILNKILNFKLFTFLGRISYSFYMSHAIILIFIDVFLRILSNKSVITNLEGILITQLSLSESIAATLLLLISVVIISYFVYNFIEKPMRNKSRLFVTNLGTV